MINLQRQELERTTKKSVAAYISDFAQMSPSEQQTELNALDEFAQQCASRRKVVEYLQKLKNGLHRLMIEN
jgi:hypothetical protein